MYSISLCVLFSAYCIVLISFVLAMRKWCIPALGIQSSYLIIWWLLLYTISCCGLINWINKSSNSILFPHRSIAKKKQVIDVWAAIVDELCDVRMSSRV